MSQMPLFVAPRPDAPAAAVDQNFVRRQLGQMLRLVRNAERMPWDAGEAASRESQFPALAAYLPAEEGEPLRAAFAAEMQRLRSRT